MEKPKVEDDGIYSFAIHRFFLCCLFVLRPIRVIQVVLDSYLRALHVSVAVQ
jgi:hypothetical protein